MMVLVTYDVSTLTSAGRRRLRRVAKTCLNYCQRVQLSLFECKVDTMQYELLQQQLLDEIDREEDCLRISRIVEPLEKHVLELGKFNATNFEDTLII